MRAAEIKKRLQELDDAWKAAGTNLGPAGGRKRDLAHFVSENLETILAKIKD